MDSRELTGWLALFQVERDEREAAAEHARHVAESQDGEVVYYGQRPEDIDDDEVEEPDGPPE